MMIKKKLKYLRGIAVFTGIVGASMLSAPTSAFADGQGLPINYDNLSFFEEPLAVPIGPATLNANLLFDQGAQYSTQSNDDTYNTRINGEFTLETQLPNSWQVGVQYVANYDRLKDNNEAERYADNLAFFAEDEWGTAAIGNVTGSVRENARRKRGFGNADIAFDDFEGRLDETGAFYSVSHNAYDVSLTADKEGRFETALSFEQPIGKRNYFTALRLRKGNVSEAPNSPLRGDSYGATVIGSYTYASFLLDGQAGYEKVDLENSSANPEHVFGSIGTQYKYGSYRFSAEGSVSRYNHDTRYSAALGSRVDVARGMSLNFGVNYTDENDEDDLKTSASVRYEL